MTDIVREALRVDVVREFRDGPQGIPGDDGAAAGPWTAPETFVVDSLTGRSGDAYVSKTAGNQGNDPAGEAPEGTNWRQMFRSFLGLLKSYRETSAAVQLAVSGTLTLDYEAGNIHPFTFGGDVTDLVLDNLPATGELVYILRPKQDAGGNAWDVTWTLSVGSINWGTAGAPDLSDAANKVDEVVIRRPDGESIWLGTYTLGFLG